MTEKKYKHTWREDGGWSKLVNPLIRTLEDLGCHILQTKEKFGEFRCYWSPPQEMSKDMATVLDYAVRNVERVSTQICIDCGSTPAKLLYDGWIAPMCEEHAKKAGREWDNGTKARWWSDKYKVDKK